MKYLLPLFALSTLSLQVQSTPAPCPNDIVEENAVVPAITPEPTAIPCDVPEEQAPAATSPPEPTDAPCEEVEEQAPAATSVPEPTDAPATSAPEPTDAPYEEVEEQAPAATSVPEPTTFEGGEWALECEEEPTVIEWTECGDEQSQVPAECDGTDGWYPISVEGVAGIFCVQQDLCVAENASGNCPLPTSGLPHGSVCGLVRTGVYGCIPASPATYSCGSNDPDATPVPEEEIPTDDLECDEEEEATVSPTPATTDYVVVEPETTETVISCGDEQSQVPAECDGTDGWYPISVEGVAEIFCVQQDLCVAENASGNCPLPTSGLPHGSVCGLVRTGVYGCIPASPATYSCGSNDPDATPTPQQTQETSSVNETPTGYNTIVLEEEEQAEEEESAYQSYAASATSSGSALPAGAVAGIALAGAVVVIAMLAAGYRRHQQGTDAEDAIQTPVGDQNI